MDREFTNDDREREVLTAEGHRVGTVRDVDGDRATVDRDEDDEGLTEKVKEMLGWDDENSNELHREHVGTVEDERILLRDQR